MLSGPATVVTAQATLPRHVVQAMRSLCHRRNLSDEEWGMLNGAPHSDLQILRDWLDLSETLPDAFQRVVQLGITWGVAGTIIAYHHRQGSLYVEKLSYLTGLPAADAFTSQAQCKDVCVEHSEPRAGVAQPIPFQADELRTWSDDGSSGTDPPSATASPVLFTMAPAQAPADENELLQCGLRKRLGLQRDKGSTATPS